MKASTYKYVTAASCVAVVALPVIVGVLASPNPNYPVLHYRYDTDSQSRIGVYLYTGLARIADGVGLSEEKIIFPLLDKANFIANDLFVITAECDSDEMAMAFVELRHASRHLDLNIVKLTSDVKGVHSEFCIIVYKPCEKAVEAYIARIKSGEKIDWQAEVDAYNLAQMEADGQLPASVE